VHEVISVNVKCTGPVAAQKWTYRHKKTLQIHYGLDAAFPRDILQQCGNPCQ